MSENPIVTQPTQEEKLTPIPTPAELIAAGWRVKIQHNRWYSPTKRRTLRKGATFKATLNHRGGYTYVHLWSPTSRKSEVPSLVGIAMCSDKDCYSKKVGVRLAIARALHGYAVQFKV